MSFNFRIEASATRWSNTVMCWVEDPTNKHFQVVRSNRWLPITAPDKQVQRILRGSVPKATEPHIPLLCRDHKQPIGKIKWWDWKFVQGEVQEKPLQTLHGATQKKIDTVSGGSEKQVDQFWQSRANKHREVWADWYLDEEEVYFNSMSTYAAGQFNPDYQLMGWWMNPTSGASSTGLFGKWQESEPTNENKKLSSFPGNYGNNILDDC